MKKLIPVCLFLLLTNQLFAQNENVESIAKGTKFIGGSLSFSFDESKNEVPTLNDSKYKSSSFGISPEVGKYLRDNLALGLYVNYGYAKHEDQYFDGNETESKSHSFGVGSFLKRNYKIVPNLFLFLQGDVWAYGSFNNNTVSDGTTYKSRNWITGLSGSPGLQLFLGKKLSLETTLGSVGYRFTLTNYPDSDARYTSHSVRINGGLDAITFSVRYFIFP